MTSGVQNRRLRIMEELDERLDELEEFHEYGSEYKSLLEETDIIEDENLLFDLERHRRNLEKESLSGREKKDPFKHFVDKERRKVCSRKEFK